MYFRQHSGGRFICLKEARPCPRRGAGGEYKGRSMSQLTFDSDKHEYRLSGRVVPSVTQVIRGMLPGWKTDEWYLTRGAAIHLGCELFDKNDLDWSTVSTEIEPRIRAWESFRRDYSGKLHEIEVALGHSTFMYAGRIDRIFLDGKDWVIADIKSVFEPQAIPQLGGYSLMWRLAAPEVRNVRGLAVEVNDDGSYKAHWLTVHEMKQAEQTFINLLGSYNFATKHNLLRKVA